MLDLMRKHAKSWVINVLIAAIAIVFVFWGVGSFRNSDVSKAAMVNGEPISIAEFQQNYKNLLDNYQRQYGDILNEELIEALNLKRQALDRLINEHLIFQQAEKMGVNVSPEALQKNIAENEIFQVDGTFNKDRYLRVLSRFNLSPAEYELIVRKELVSREVLRIVGSTAKVSDAEAKEFFHVLKDKIDLDYVLFQPDAFRRDVELTDEEKQAYYDKNKEQYRVPAKVKAAYLAFRPDDFENIVTVTDDEIADAYEMQLDQYKEPEKANARHILIKVEEGASEEDVQKAKAKAEEVLALVMAEGADFAELAKQYSEGPSKDSGGDLGWFQREQMVKEFSDAVFNMKKGEITGPVKTDFGFHIIKLEDIKPAHTRTIEEVKDEIRNKLTKEKATELAASKAEESYDEVTLSQNLEEAAKKLDLDLKTTDFFMLNETQSEIDPDPKFNQVALSLKKGEIGPMVDTKTGHYIIKAVDRQESYVPEMKDVIGSVEEDLAREKAAEMAKKAAEGFLAKTKEENGWDKAIQEYVKPVVEASEAAEESGDAGDDASTNPENAQTEAENVKPEPKNELQKAVPGVTGPFTRNERVPVIGSDQAVSTDAFSLTKIGQVGPKTYDGTGGYYVIRLKEKIPASDEDFEKEKESLIKNLTAGKAQSYIEQWLEKVRSESEIEVETKLLN